MAMSRCKTCKWWSQDYDVRVPWEDANEHPLPNWGECLLAHSLHNKRPTEPFTLAYALDHEEYEAELLTHEDFGCVQHEPEVPA